MPVNTESQPPTHDYTASVIRTLTAIVVGVLLGWLGTDITGVSEATLTPVVSAILGSAYHAIVRAIEHKWPKAGWLLGWPTPPTYPKGD
jgi:hypothetical protein